MSNFPKKKPDRGLSECVQNKTKRFQEGSKPGRNKETFQEGSKPGRTQEVLLDRGN